MSIKINSLLIGMLRIKVFSAVQPEFWAARWPNFRNAADRAGLGAFG